MDKGLYINVVKTTRLLATTEELETGKFIYCTDTGEAFFDEDTRLRIYMGKIKTIDFEEDLKDPTVDDISRFIFIIQDNKIKYSGSDLKWHSVQTRDEMVDYLSSVDKFQRRNLMKNGVLIAPTTFSDCVITGEGATLDEILDELKDIINKWMIEGIPGELITSGTIDYARIPKTAVMDFYPVENKAHRLRLTINEIQNGDVVQEEDSGMMYFVVDDTKLGSEDGFKAFTVGSAPWANIINKPLSLTLKNGATGTVTFNTGTTNESQKLSMTVNLNVDHTNAGILKKQYGGTGNQTGTAAFVERDIKETEMKLAGFQSATGKMQQMDSISVRNGIITAERFETRGEDSSSFTNITVNKMTLEGSDKTIVIRNDDKSIRKVISIDNINKYIIFGDKDNDMNSKVVGPIVEINAGQKIINRIGTRETLIIDSSTVKSTVPVEVKESLAIKNNNLVVGKMGYDSIGNSVVYNNPTPNTDGLVPNMSSSVTESSVNGMIISNDNFTYAFRKQRGVGPQPDADNIIEVKSDSVKINGTTYIGGNTKITGDMMVKGTIYGTTSQSKNADTLDGYHAEDFMKNDGSNNTKPPVITSAVKPAGRVNCVWIDTTTGIANYWNGSDWTPISNTWKA